MLWAKYAATGESLPVKRIISALAWKDSDTRYSDIGELANRSLTAEAARVGRVLDICKRVARNQGSAAATRLAEIGELARRRRAFEEMRGQRERTIADERRPQPTAVGIGKDFVFRVVDEKSRASIANAEVPLDWDMATASETRRSDRDGRLRARGLSLHGMIEIRVNADGCDDLGRDFTNKP